MQFRNKTEAQKIEPQMAPMIDVVFQLLIFFLLTLRIIEPEGDFNINMPIGMSQQLDPDAPIITTIRVKMVATADGDLAVMRYGNNSLGNGPEAFERLRGEILNSIGRPGNPMAEDMEVEIDADYNLDFEHVIHAVSACTGRLTKSGKLVRYIEKIKFAPPKAPPSS